MPNIDTNYLLRKGRKNLGQRASNGQGRNAVKECTCPNCGCKVPHTRGIPCSEAKCPSCQASMKGTYYC